MREIIGSKNFALINLSLNFCETTIYDNKVFLENFVAVQLQCVTIFYMKLLRIFWNYVPVAFWANKWNDMHLKRLYQTVNKVMCHWINCTCRVLPYWYLFYGYIQGTEKNVLSCIIARIRGYVYKVLGINSPILLHLHGYNAKSKILLYFFKIYNVNGQQLNFQELLCYHLLSSHKRFT